MEEPSLRTSRQVIALAILVSLLLGGVGFVVGRSTAPAPDLPPDETSEPIVVPPADLLGGTMARADLLRLASSAADAAGAGRLLPDSLRQSAGRRFELRLPLGCGGPAAPDAPDGWTYDERSGRLRVFANPVRWDASDWIEQDGATVEGIEGFWIARPWTSSDVCPPTPPALEPADDASGSDAEVEDEAEADADETPAAEMPAAETPTPVHTLAIGQVRTTGSARGGRRAGDLFETVTRVPAGELDTSQGFRLRLIGRLTNAIGTAPVTCRAENPATAPVCLITAAIDEVAIENPATGQVLATWNLAQRDAAPSN